MTIESKQKQKNIILTRKTINAIRRMIDAVMAEPKYLNQNTFPEREDCGKTCCGAGWAVFNKIGPKAYKALVMSTPDPSLQINWEVRALEALGLPTNINTQTLFCSAWDWPEKFADMYRKAKGPVGRAKAFKARWENFIEQDGEGLITAQQQRSTTAEQTTTGRKVWAS
jgi:hypothetical protein